MQNAPKLRHKLTHSFRITAHLHLVWKSSRAWENKHVRSDCCSLHFSDTRCIYESVCLLQFLASTGTTTRVYIGYIESAYKIRTVTNWMHALICMRQLALVSYITVTAQLVLPHCIVDDNARLLKIEAGWRDNTTASLLAQFVAARCVV